MCQPELDLNAEALNARLTRMEERIASGDIPMAQRPAKAGVPEDVVDEERPPMPVTTMRRPWKRSHGLW